MAQNLKPGGGIISGINVTPLVDITLVLLIVFIVTAKIIVAPAVPLDLPTASQSEGTQLVFSVILTKSGSLFANGSPLASSQELTSLAKIQFQKDPDVRVVINADGDVPHRQVIRVLDALKSAGLSKIAFGSSPPESSEP